MHRLVGDREGSVASLVLALSVILRPEVALANDAATAAPNQLVYESRPRWGLILGGAGLFGFTYGSSCAGLGNGACVPVAGPFIVLAKRIGEDRRSSSNHDGVLPPAFVYGALVSLGILELMGVGMVVAGFAEPKRVPKNAVAYQLNLAPVVHQGAAGLTVGGRF